MRYSKEDIARIQDLARQGNATRTIVAITGFSESAVYYYGTTHLNPKKWKRLQDYNKSRQNIQTEKARIWRATHVPTEEQSYRIREQHLRWNRNNHEAKMEIQRKYRARKRAELRQQKIAEVQKALGITPKKPLAASRLLKYTNGVAKPVKRQSCGGQNT